MELVFVGGAAVVAWVAGAIWYWAFGGTRMRLSGAQADNTGHPAGKSPLPYFIHGALLVIVAATMRALFLRGGIDGLWTGMGIGAALGALIVTPMLLLSGIHPQGGNRLTLIDGGHATLICALMGAILAAI